MTTRIDGTCGCGIARADNWSQTRWQVLIANDTPDFKPHLAQGLYVATDANHSDKPKSSTTPTREGEPTDNQLRIVYGIAKGPFVDSLRAVYRHGVDHGEAKVCKRLPRLWGRWDGFGWRSLLMLRLSGDVGYCEFDPMTGGPKDTA